MVNFETPEWLWPTQRFLKDAYWAVRHRVWPRDRYHVVRTGLPPGYYDQDYRMLYACFALLESYVKEWGGEQEIADHIANMHDNPDEWGGAPLVTYIEKETEVLALYRWWKDRDDSWDTEAEDRDQVMFMRLAAIRQYIWV